MKYIVNLFPSNPAESYVRFKERIEECGPSKQLGKFCWVIQANSDTADIRITLKGGIDDDSSFIVCAFEFWKEYNLPPKTKKWLDN